MENPSSLEQNINVLSRLMVDLKHAKNQVAIRGKWDMVTWLKKVRDREWQVDEIMKEFNEKTTGFFLNDLDTKDELNRKLIDSLTVVKVLIEEGNADSESIPVSSLEKYQPNLFSSEYLKKFTDFDKKLGSGAYSDVYEGEFEGEQVAVKVLKENAGMVYETFLTERITMGRIFHKNLVKLHGFCFDDDIKALVYEYMENGSLDKILYKNSNSVEWAKLYDIALGIARGLAYLHHADRGERIIHHDVKAANVLIDQNLCPKITDFGVSNLMRSDVTHLTNTRIRGTNYYSAPEIHQPLYPITCKCDVYSFGLMLFEILGRRCHIPKGKFWFPHEVSDILNKQPETIMKICGITEKDREKAMIVLKVAMWCSQYTPSMRPSMSDVVEVLEKEMSVTTPPYPFHHHNLFGHSMVPSLQGTPVNDKREEENEEELEEYLSEELKKYSPMDLEVFTSGFSQLIRANGLEEEYIGIFPDGVKVAIEVFHNDNIIGQEVFMTEARTMSALYHKNILRTYGYCFDQNMIALMYEYMPRGSLDVVLYMNHLSKEWGRLYGIVIEIARVLSYSHKGQHHLIIHFDVKPPKITYFGLEKFLARDVPHFTFTRTRWTPGYAAPEMWIPESQVTSKAGVYSFGVKMFEVLGIRSNNKPLQVWRKFETGHIKRLEELETGITRKNGKDAKILSMTGLWCVQYTPGRRPSMRAVVNKLEKQLPITSPPNPFRYDDDDDKKEEELELLLKLYEEKCPPGGENSVIIYTTTIDRMKRSFKESNDVRAILRSHQIVMIERDVYGDGDYEEEIIDVMGKMQIIPILFVKGRFIGEADEVKRLEAEGKLKVLLHGIPTEE